MPFNKESASKAGKKSKRTGVQNVHTTAFKDLIMNAYLGKYSVKYGKKINLISARLLELLMIYDWPGNTQELELLVETAVVNASTNSLDIDSFPVNYRHIFDKLLKKLRAGGPMYKAENELFKDIVEYFKVKSAYGESALPELLDVSKEAISKISSI